MVMRAVLLESSLVIPVQEYGDLYLLAHESLEAVRTDVRTLPLTYEYDESYMMEALAALGARTEPVDAGLALVGFEGAASDAAYCYMPEGVQGERSGLWWLENQMLVRQTCTSGGDTYESATHTWSEIDTFPKWTERPESTNK